MILIIYVKVLHEFSHATNGYMYCFDIIIIKDISFGKIRIIMDIILVILYN